ncbi:hypothetical protein QKS44_gp4 [Aphis citricidus meson-like virus]|uniref:Uncharacterized protein n=1 Tax=Aphis citricidus meson-like virus TaxID=2788946 RepID=A0AAE7TNE1_9NIDO|nr:hypothetical protein QKS44_gp4 [Aphis citricidus meson-like virus]QPD01784.1 hypothetical protein [Aphis citricidus meson-like virus]
MSDGKIINKRINTTNNKNTKNNNNRNNRNKINNNNPSQRVYQNTNKYWVQPQPPHPNAVYLPYPQVPQYIVQQPNSNKNNKVFQKQRNSRSKSSTRAQSRSNSQTKSIQRTRSQSRQRTTSVNFNINTTKSTDNNASHNIGPEQDAIKYLRWRKSTNHNGRPVTSAKFPFALPMANRIDQCLVRSKLNDDIFALCFNLQHSAFYNDSLWSKTNHKPSADDAQHLLSIVRTACDVYIDRLKILLSSDNTGGTNSVITISQG